MYLLVMFIFYFQKGANIINTNQILTDIVKQLELTPTQFIQIERSYHALADELQKGNEYANVYPQGSIRLGTTIKPYSGTKDADYDVDLVAEYPIEKNNISPIEVRDLVGNVLKDNNTYKPKLSEKKRCWRVEYAEQNGVGFHADILPSIPESKEIIQGLKTSCGLDSLTLHSIAITHKESNSSPIIWNMSNPKGYAEWFCNINKYGKEVEFIQRKQQIFVENSGLFNTIDDIPDALIKTPIQRVIQVLKRHRDVYFSRSKREEDKPISIIITTLVAKIVEEHSLNELNFKDMLNKICRILVEAEGLMRNQNFSQYEARNAIFKKDNKWESPNPVNNGENFADAWNVNPNKARFFFEWLKAVERDIVLNSNKDEFERILCDVLEVTYKSQEKIKTISKPIDKNAKQPWGQGV